MPQPFSAPRNRCAIALGSNLGDSSAILHGAITALADRDDFQIAAISSWYCTAPIGPPQPDYLNGCAIGQTSLTPHQLMTVLLGIEAQYGRERRDRWGPRTLDLDLLLFDDVIVKTQTLTIPHPRMGDRAFVLVPLAEIAADWIEPTSGHPIWELAERIDPSGIKKL